MLSRIRTLRSLFSKGEPEAVHHISTVTPVGYHAPRGAGMLCASPLRKTCLQQIWENCSLPADIYQRLYLAPLNGLLAVVQKCAGHAEGKVVTVRRLRRSYAAVHDLCGQAGKRVYVSTRRGTRRAGRTECDVECGDFLVGAVLAPASSCDSGGSCLTVKAGFRE